MYWGFPIMALDSLTSFTREKARIPETLSEKATAAAKLRAQSRESEMDRPAAEVRSNEIPVRSLTVNRYIFLQPLHRTEPCEDQF